MRIGSLSRCRGKKRLVSLAAVTTGMVTLEKGRIVPETRIHYHRHDHAHP
ncbi:MAG: hypothetical protein ACLFPI_08320 [Desulfobacterales bacterium]